MKLQKNSSQIKRNTVDARFESNAGMAVEASIKNINRIGAAIDEFKAVHLQKEEEKDVQRVIAANNEYDRRTLALNSDVRERFKEADAVAADSYYKEQEALIRRQVYDNSGIKYKKSEQAFNNRSESSAIKELGFLSEYQQQEAQKYKGALVQNSLDSEVSKYLEYGDADSFAQGVNNISVNIDALGYGKEQTELVKRQYVNDYVSRCVQSLKSRKDYQEAKSLLDEAKAQGYISEETSVQLGTSVDEHLKAVAYDSKDTAQSSATAESAKIYQAIEDGKKKSLRRSLQIASCKSILQQWQVKATVWIVCLLYKKSMQTVCKWQTT